MNPSPQFCPNCGAERRRTNARFCHKCGHPLAPVTAPSPEAQPAPKKSRWPLLIGILLLALMVVVAVVSLGPGRDMVQKWLASEVASVETPHGPEPPELPPAETPAETPTPADTAAPPATTPPEDTATPAATSPPPTAPPEPTDTPVPTATPKPTNTPIPTPTPTPIPIVSVQQNVWLRSGPSTDYDRVRKLLAGESAIALGRNAGGDWLQVETEQGEVGWVFGNFLDTAAGDVASLPEVQAPSLPRCNTRVDGRLAAAYERSLLGCATNPTHTTWAAWESFQTGAMLWRDDVNKVTVFYNQNGWVTLPDKWAGQSTPSRGSPPPDLRQPVRGFGWIWGNRDEVFNGIGWATDEEKGVCLIVQDFQHGFVFTKSNASHCKDRAGNSNFSRFAELPRMFITAYDDGQMWRSY